MSLTDRTQHRQLDRKLDRLAHQPAPDDGAAHLDPALAATAHRLFRLYGEQQAQPHDRFVARLEQSLISNVNLHSQTDTAAVPNRRQGPRPVTLPGPRAHRPGRTDHDAQRRWPALIELTAVAAILLALLGAAVGRDQILDPFRRHNVAHAPAGSPPEGMYRGNAARTGEMPGPGPEGEPGLLWRFDYQDLLPGSGGAPTLAGGTVYVTQSMPGIVSAFDTTTGQLKWQATVGVMGQISPAVANGLVYASTQGVDDDGFLIALDAATGKERWRFRTGGTGNAEQTSPAVVDGTVYVTSDEEMLFAVDALTGQGRWRFALDTSDLATPQPYTTGFWAIDAPSPVSPAVADGLVYAASNDGVLFAIDATTGQQHWRFVSDGNYLHTPTVADGQLFLVAGIMTMNPALKTANGWVYALDAKTGAQRWVWSDGLSSRPPTVANGLVYVAGRIAESNDVLTALDATSGTAIWTSDEIGSGSTPVVVGRTIYAESDGGLYALDAATGATEWRVDLGSVGASDPVVADGRVIVAVDGKLVAIAGNKAGSGTPVATPATGGDVSGRPPCTVPPKPASDLAPSGTPVADLVPDRPDWENSTRQPILMSEIPAGSSIDRETIDGILLTLSEIAVCDRPGYGLRLATLFTDDFFRRSADHALFFEYSNGTISQIVQAVDADGQIVTTLGDVRQLPDGRVGVLRMFDFAPGVGEFTIFAHHGDRWLVDETRQVAPQLDMPG